MNKGFTLIELSVVLAIIILLVLVGVKSCSFEESPCHYEQLKCISLCQEKEGGGSCEKKCLTKEKICEIEYKNKN